jgi:flagellar hook protein FlgE
LAVIVFAEAERLIMTISSSLNAGVAGLNANANRLASISDNIANSGTYGYKRVVTDFHSMVTTEGSGTGGKYSAGGVRTTNMRLIDERGPLVTTANPTDLSVRGRGMLPVTNETDVVNANGDLPMMLTTTGSFRTDASGILKTDTGLVLMGWPANANGEIPTFPRDTADGLEPVQINVNQFGGEPTTEMALGVNLPATETAFGASGDAQELSVEYFDNLGTSQSVSVVFTPDTSVVGSSNTWNMVMRDSASAGAIVGEYNITFDDSV